MRLVSIAICTSGEPVSVPFRPCWSISSCLTSLVSAMWPPLLGSPKSPRGVKEGTAGRVLGRR